MAQHTPVEILSFYFLNGVMITTNLNSSGEKGYVGIDANGISNLIQ